ncbi:hypothetical protein JCM19239_7794 [Vibrio variabilis]|uniref:Uncharacterized protein n=1 Tax=Vibrio variabilis TaxID=990271 RepID=A0ABQ0J6L6_9VIBR|nr:hypothetical protein JCM19239_7794 [Vibrio variabilis]
MLINSGRDSGKVFELPFDELIRHDHDGKGKRGQRDDR